MRKSSVFCHSVVVITMLVLGTENALAALSCQESFFSDTVKQSAKFDKASFTQAETAMLALKQNGVLTSIRTSNTANDHIQYFAEQLPVLMSKLEVRYGEAENVLLAKTTNRQFSEKRKSELAKIIQQAHDQLALEASMRLQSNTVTYEWYMRFFLKALIFNDTTLQVYKTSQIGLHRNEDLHLDSYGAIVRNLETMMGQSNVFYSGNRESVLFATLGKEYSSLIKDAYFVKHLPSKVLIPALFKPRNSDIIEAEKMGVEFITLSSLGEASLQAEQALKQNQNQKNMILQSRWQNYHSKISEKIKGDAALEALYVYVIKDAGLQSSIVSRMGALPAKPVEATAKTSTPHVIRRAHRMMVANVQTGHPKEAVTKTHQGKASEFLAQHFKENKREVSTIASETTIEAFLKVIRHIEQEGLASK